MDGLLHFPVATPPEPGEIIRVAHGILWLRMPLPFALNHINLWLIDDGPTWTAVDTGFALPESKAVRLIKHLLPGRRPLIRNLRNPSMPRSSLKPCPAPRQSRMAARYCF